VGTELAVPLLSLASNFITQKLFVPSVGFPVTDNQSPPSKPLQSILGVEELESEIESPDIYL
jgi:hypothetical protein